MSVSVVIPVHNAEAFIDYAVGSVLRQTVPARELVLVDDGSSDRSASIIRELAARHDNIRIVSQSPAQGPSAARNAGWRAASSEWIAFLDADDVWHAKHLASLLEGARAFPDAGLVFSDIVSFHDQSDISLPVVTRVVAEEVSDAPLALLRRNVVPQSAVMVRRTLLEVLNGYDASVPVAEDYDLWCRASVRAQFVRVNVHTVGRRLHATQLSGRRAADMARIPWEVRNRMRAEIWHVPGRDQQQWLSEERLLFQRELREGWRCRDRAVLDALVNAGATSPSVSDMAERARVQRSLLWHPWRLMLGVYDMLPPRVVSALRTMRAAGSA